MTVYYPEMQEAQPADTWIKAEHVHNDTYSVQWLPADEERAADLLKRLRIRPRAFGITADLGPQRHWALITGAAYAKLAHRAEVAAEHLLD